MDAAILAALIVLNGVFALSEIALLYARGALLKAQAADPGAAAALRAKEDPTDRKSTRLNSSHSQISYAVFCLKKKKKKKKEKTKKKKKKQETENEKEQQKQHNKTLIISHQTEPRVVASNNKSCASSRSGCVEN